MSQPPKPPLAASIAILDVRASSSQSSRMSYLRSMVSKLTLTSMFPPFSLHISPNTIPDQVADPASFYLNCRYISNIPLPDPPPFIPANAMDVQPLRQKPEGALPPAAHVDTSAAHQRLPASCTAIAQPCSNCGLVTRRMAQGVRSWEFQTLIIAPL